MPKPKKKSNSKPSSRKWPAHFAARVKRMRNRMKALNLDAFLITCEHDIRYFTGFCGEDAWALILPRSVIIQSDRRFEEELANDCPFTKNIIRKKSHPETLAGLLPDTKKFKLGLQSNYTTLAVRKTLVKHIGASRLQPTSNEVLKLRTVKDNEEIKRLTKAVRIQEKGFRAACEQIKPGMTEKHIAGLLEFEMRKAGADGTSFPIIVAVDANGSKPHYSPGNVKAKKNSSILIDFGALHNGYHSDMTRVIGLGGMSKKIKEIYEIVNESFLAGIDAIKPGVELKAVDAAARKVIEKAGYGPQFSHSLGHGIGLEIHEQPSLSTKAEGILEPGHVVTVEPGIYLPGIGGVRLEDDILVTDKGHKNLCQLPTGLDAAII